MTEGKILLQPGTLWQSVIERTESALKCGALLSIPTEFEYIEQDGVRFLVRILANLVRKDAAKKKQVQQTAASGKDFNPFLPYEEDLFVADISETHVCLLNKFNVVDHHILIITRAFEEQESLLTLEDFAAMWACLAEYDGLAFYNGGQVSGASQRHKHLQMVPLPLTTSGDAIPIQPLLAKADFQDAIATIPGLPFKHAIAALNPQWAESPLQAAKTTMELYNALLHAVGITAVNDNRQSGAYNLLATREWMLIVPRSQEEYELISVNSLGFAGALLVRNQQQMQLLKDQGPMNILKNVGMGNW
ncbi:Ap4A phosphorylase II [Tolypothrix tenuis PCC 7101]|uniref:Ap4A phosphorylase II n=1 Tax=Tolypothrix tenuis PCC 7101 TaxID=231146 RepID=A0A1Z4N3W4_9CYAN|nr:phosphorylase [Aulosira sp. FACHB-113]BAZ00396.1 Ap4A phosphorylase II [Tolypothrix tenuis PCC 7101]BAZ75683.1 Ap4A phosphorylase II [Aulosira laxa NIES-50]